MENNETLAERIGDARGLASLIILKELQRFGIADSVSDDIVVELLKKEAENIQKAFQDGRRWNNSYSPYDYYVELYSHNFKNENEFNPYKQ
jgi:hypothetical protein